MLLCRLCIAILFFLLSHVSFAKRYSVSYDNHHISAKTWEEVDISWYNKFNPKKPNYARLLRPIIYAHHYGLVQHGQIRMNLSEFGVPNADVTIDKVKPLYQKSISTDKQLSSLTSNVIGLFVHQTNDVRTYRFRDSKGSISIIHATPNHPFYVENLHAYVPINMVSDTDKLMGHSDKIVHLSCSQGKHIHCGLPYRRGKTTTVYNIEVYQHHIYRVSKNEILVHNGGCGDIPVDSIKLRKFVHEASSYRALTEGKTSARLCALYCKLTTQFLIGEIDEFPKNEIDASLAMMHEADEAGKHSLVGSLNEDLDRYIAQVQNIDGDIPAQLDTFREGYYTANIRIYNNEGGSNHAVNFYLDHKGIITMIDSRHGYFDIFNSEAYLEIINRNSGYKANFNRIGILGMNHLFKP